MKKKFAVFWVWAIFHHSVFAADPTKLPMPALETLPNGLTIAWFVSDHLPVVDLGLLVKTGYREDPLGKSGTAELLSSVLDRGAGGKTAQEIARSIEELGASRNSSAEEDLFSVAMHGLAPDATTLLSLLAMIALQPDLPPAEVTREHGRLLDRWSHIGDYGEALVALTFRRLILAGTPYGRGNFLSASEFKKVTREDLIAFHKKHFTPKNSILMVVGRVNQEEFRTKILEKFGSWQGEIAMRDRKTYADSRLPRAKGGIVLVDRPNLTQAQVKIGFPAPLITAPEHYALSVSNALLGEYFNSRLNSLVRDKLGLTYAIGSSFSYSKDFAYFIISSATRNESVGQLIKKSIEVMKDLKAGPIQAEEVQMAKEYLVGGFPLGTSTLGAVAMRWLAGQILELGPGYLNEYIPRVQKVTPVDVIQAVNKNFKLDQLVIVVAGESKEIEKSLNAAKLRPVRKVAPEKLY